MTASIPADSAPADPRRRGRPKSEPSDWERFGSYLPGPLAREFRVICAHLGKEQRHGLRDAVASWVKDNKIPGYQSAENSADAAPTTADPAAPAGPGATSST